MKNALYNRIVQSPVGDAPPRVPYRELCMSDHAMQTDGAGG